jgi:hypothetical protein
MANFAIVFAALLSLASVIDSRSFKARQLAAATIIGQSQMERLKLLGYRGLIDTGGLEGTLGPLTAQGDASPSGTYTVTWDVRDNVPEAGVKQVVVVVSWSTDSGRRKQLNLETVMSDVAP